MKRPRNRTFSYFFVLAVFFCLHSRAQSYFIDSKLFEINLDTFGFGYTSGIEIKNTGTVNLNFTWELIQKDTLLDSEFDLCNSGICCTTLPLAGSMPPIAPGDIGWLKMHMFAGHVTGVNTIRYVLHGDSDITLDTLTYRIIVGYSSPLGVSEKRNSKEQILLFPNPANDHVVLNLPASKAMPATISIYDVNGKNVSGKKANLAPGVNRIYFSTGELPAGVYTAEVSTPEGIQKKQLVISK
jgi:hypothetical protein